MSFADERIAFEGLTFDDVLLVPAYSDILPSQVSLKTRFSRNIELEIPFVSAAMDTVTESAMAIAMAKAGGIGVIHKNMSVVAQAAQVGAVKAASAEFRVAAGVGITGDALERVEALASAGADAVVLDSAHGHSRGVIELLRLVKSRFPGIDVVVGNVATAEGAAALVEAGADGVKVGIGPGSICTTRIVAGVGVPQLSAIYDASKAVAGSGATVIADGGLRYSGDLVKALAAGGDCVMCGSMFAGSDEAPGEIVECDGRSYKTYRGMGSTDAMMAGSSDRYFQSGTKQAGKLVPEGVVGRVACKGCVSDIIYQLAGGLRAGMGYCGAPDIASLARARFVRISASGMAESHPHDITIAKEAPNYKK